MHETAPGTVLARLSPNEALVAIDGRDRLVSTQLVRHLRVGDRVVVHAGTIVAKVSSREATEIEASIDDRAAASTTAAHGEA